MGDIPYHTYAKSTVSSLSTLGEDVESKLPENLHVEHILDTNLESIKFTPIRVTYPVPTIILQSNTYDLSTLPTFPGIISSMTSSQGTRVYRPSINGNDEYVLEEIDPGTTEQNPDIGTELNSFWAAIENSDNGFIVEFLDSPIQNSPTKNLQRNPLLRQSIMSILRPDPSKAKLKSPKRYTTQQKSTGTRGVKKQNRISSSHPNTAETLSSGAISYSRVTSCSGIPISKKHSQPIRRNKHSGKPVKMEWRIKPSITLPLVVTEPPSTEIEYDFWINERTLTFSFFPKLQGKSPGSSSQGRKSSL
ncbi:hypothetical protein LXL04_003107 [Taraxacum kok-saghyz]